MTRKTRSIAVSVLTCAMLTVHGIASAGASAAGTTQLSWASVPDAVGDVRQVTASTNYLPPGSIDIRGLRVIWAPRALHLIWRIADVRREGHSATPAYNSRGDRTDVTFQQFRTVVRYWTRGIARNVHISQIPGEGGPQIYGPAVYGAVEKKWQAAISGTTSAHDNVVTLVLPHRLMNVHMVHISFRSELDGYTSVIDTDKMLQLRLQP